MLKPKTTNYDRLNMQGKNVKSFFNGKMLRQCPDFFILKDIFIDNK